MEKQTNTMKTKPPAMQSNPNAPAVIALGMFDGVHAGHRTLLAHTAALAAQMGAASVVYTFSNHPRSVFLKAPLLLMTAAERERTMLGLGIGRVVMETFTKEIAALSPRAYVERLLEGCAVRAMVVGFNYSFGAGGLGREDTLRALGEEYGFRVDVIPPVSYEGEPVSSTRIRGLIESGEIEKANRMLVEPFAVEGPVVSNRHIGTSIGFPTANQMPPAGKVLPLPGVYATTVWHADRPYPAVTNVGDNPTVEGTFTTVESHLLGFEGDLYGAEIRTMFRTFLRKEERFISKEALAKQIAQDVVAARALQGEP